MKILMTGSNGQLGRCLQDRVGAYEFEVVAVDRETVDISDELAVQAFAQQCQPDLLINAAAYTAVDKAESEADRAMQVNGAGAGYLAKACQWLNIPIIHISTDYVFDGTAVEFMHRHTLLPLLVCTVLLS